MNRQDKIRATKAISIMVNSFPDQSGINPDLQLASFLECVDDYSAEAVEEVCKRFRKGEVVGCDPRFLPSSAQFTMRVQEMDAVMKYKALPALPAPEKPYSPPLAGHKLKALSDTLAGRRTWASLAEEYGLK